MDKLNDLSKVSQYDPDKRRVTAQEFLAVLIQSSLFLRLLRSLILLF